MKALETPAAYAQRAQLLLMMQRASEIAYDPRISVGERFRALMQLHYALWGVARAEEGSVLLRGLEREETRSLARKCVIAGDVGVRCGRVHLGPFGEFELADDGRAAIIPLEVLVWLTSALAAESKLPDLKSGEPGLSDAASSAVSEE